MQWNDTDAVSKDAITQIKQESSGKQHAFIICELNVITANCLACQRNNLRQGSTSTNHDANPNISDSPNNENHKDNEPNVNFKSKCFKMLLRWYFYMSRAKSRDLCSPQAMHK